MWVSKNSSEALANIGMVTDTYLCCCESDNVLTPLCVVLGNPHTRQPFEASIIVTLIVKYEETEAQGRLGKVFKVTKLVSRTGVHAEVSCSKPQFPTTMPLDISC